MEAIVAGLPEPGRSRMQALRAALLGLGGVAEKVIVDYDARAESPAFYVGARQLCHVHPGGDALDVTVSLGRALTFEVLAAKDVPEAIRAVVERTKEYGATRWVGVTVKADEDLAGLVALLRRKHRFLLESEGELAIPRDQRTLETFE